MTIQNARRHAFEFLLANRPAALRRRLGTVRLSHADDDQQHRKRRRQQRPPEHGAKVVGIKRHQGDGQQRPGKPSDRIERLADAVARAPYRGRRDVGDQGVAGRIADPLADAIDETRGQNFPGRAGEREHRLGDGGKTITDADQELALADAVGERAGEDLRNGGRRFRDALDQADVNRAGADDRGEEHRQQAVNELG